MIASPRQSSLSPDSYTPKDLAQKILTSKAALEGERKQITVLFADLKGSMELLAERDPEDARKILDPVLELMMEAVHRYEGTVNQVMGDGIMALFGAPLAHEDHAVRACYAALRIQESIKQYAKTHRVAATALIQIRVGLNSGEVVVRSIGSDLRMDYTAVGQTTHLAARMEQMAPPGSILLSASTMSLVEGYVEVAPKGAAAVKGLKDPVELYELVGVGTARSRLEAAVARGLTRFVGRDRELGVLLDAADSARAGSGKVVAVVGEAGVGKSRLYWEFRHAPEITDFLVAASYSVSYGKATAWLPVVELLKAYFKVGPDDDEREISAKVTGKLRGLDPALEPTLPALLSLLDVPVPDTTWTTLDPRQRRRLTIDAVTRLLVRESVMQPLVVVFEDLHWIDSETQALLDDLVDAVPAARILLLVNYRPEYQSRWRARPHHSEHRVEALTPDSAAELLHVLLGADASVVPLSPVLVERTQGNPFFLEESVRALVEIDTLVGTRGAYRLAKPLATVNVPATVQAVLASRIDRLSADDKALLQSAAMIGKDVPFNLLEVIAPDSEQALRHALLRLLEAEFLYETHGDPDREYTFKHALTHEVTYDGVLQDRRRLVHGTILEAIERLHQHRLEEWVPRLAHHALRGEVWDKAVTYCRQAGLKSSSRSANVEGVAYVEQSLECLSRMPPSEATTALGIDLRVDLYSSLWALARVEPMLACLREALALAERLGDQHRLAAVLANLTQAFSMSGDSSGGLEFGLRGLDVAEALGDLLLEERLSFFVSQTMRNLGLYRDSVVKADRALELLLRRGGTHSIFPVEVTMRSNLAMSLGEMGQFERAIAIAQDAHRVADSDQRPFGLCDACWGMGNVRLSQGHPSEAIAEFELGRTRARTLNVPLYVPMFAALVGYTCALSGRVEDGLPLMEQALAEFIARRSGGVEARMTVYLAEAYVLAGRTEEARTMAERAIVLCREQRRRGFEAWALRVLAATAAHSDCPDIAEAAAYFAQALALADELGAYPHAARCHLGLGALYHRAGERERAREHLMKARTMSREMGLQFWPTDPRDALAMLA